jgi:hypothetical protein
MIKRISLTLSLLFTIVSAGACASLYNFSEMYDKNFHNNKYGAWCGFDNLMRHDADRKYGVDEKRSEGMSFSDYEKLRHEKMDLIYKGKGRNGGLVWQAGTNNYLTWGTYSNPNSHVGKDVPMAIAWHETMGFKYNHIPDGWFNKETILCREW